MASYPKDHNIEAWNTYFQTISADMSSTVIYLSCFGVGILVGICFYCCLKRWLTYKNRQRHSNNNYTIWDWQLHSQKCEKCSTECELCLTNTQHCHIVPFQVDDSEYAIMEPQNIMCTGCNV